MFHTKNTTISKSEVMERVTKGLETGASEWEPGWGEGGSCEYVGAGSEPNSIGPRLGVARRGFP